MFNTRFPDPRRMTGPFPPGRSRFFRFFARCRLGRSREPVPWRIRCANGVTRCTRREYYSAIHFKCQECLKCFVPGAMASRAGDAGKAFSGKGKQGGWGPAERERHGAPQARLAERLEGACRIDRRESGKTPPPAPERPTRPTGCRKTRKDLIALIRIRS